MEVNPNVSKEAGRTGLIKSRTRKRISKRTIVVKKEPISLTIKKMKRELFFKIKQLDTKLDKFSEAYEECKQKTESLNLSLEQIFDTVATDNPVPSTSCRTDKSWCGDTLLELNCVKCEFKPVSISMLVAHFLTHPTEHSPTDKAIDRDMTETRAMRLFSLKTYVQPKLTDDVVDLICKGSTDKFLVDVFHGEKNEIHDNYFQNKYISDTNNGKVFGIIHNFTDQCLIYEKCLNVCKQLSIIEGFDIHHYIFNVMVPLAIIKAISIDQRVDYDFAYELFIKF